MKENENLDDINVNNNENDVQKVSMSDTYINQGSIADRLSFLINNKAYLNARKQSPKNKPTQEELDEHEKLENDFIEKYITNGTPEIQNHVFTTLGKLTGENIEQTYYEKKEFEAGFSKEEDHLDQKAYWLTRHSNSGISNDVISYFSKKMRDALCNDYQACETAFKNSGLSENSTMEDFLKSAGYTKSEITAQLQKLGTTAKQNVYNFYGEKNHFGDAVVQNYALHKSQNYITNGSRKYFSENKPYEEIKRELEDINKKNKLSPDETGIEDWVKNAKKQKLKRINGLNQREFEKKLKNRYEKKNYTKEPIAEKQIYEANQKYQSLKTMEEKLDYLVILNAMEQCKDQLQVSGSDKAIDYPTKMAADLFAKEFTNTPKLSVIKKYYQNVGKKAGEFTVAFQKERDEILTHFPEDDPNRLQKANYLAEHTYEGGTKRTSFNIISQMITGNSSTMMETIWNAANIGPDITMGDFLKKTGMGEAEYNDFFSKNPNITPDSKASEQYTHDSFGNLNQDIEYSMKKDFFDKTTAKWMKDGRDAFAAKNKIKGDKLQQYNEDAHFLASDYKLSKIQEWANDIGSKELDKYIKNSYHEVMNEYNKKYVGGENYDQYIRLHTGYDVEKMSTKDKQENLAKSIAASILKTTENSLDIKKIHSYAKTVKALPSYKAIISNPDKLDYYLAGESRIYEVKSDVLKSISEVNENSVEEYVGAMKKLQDNMMTSEKRSDKYIEFHKAVKAIGNLSGKYDFTREADRKAACKELLELNTILLNKTVSYITDKESVRTNDDGKSRFNNALDALGNLHAYVPKSRSNIDPIIAKINTKRKAAVGSEKFVDISKFNGNRAEQAKNLRNAKAQNKNAERTQLGMR